MNGDVAVEETPSTALGRRLAKAPRSVFSAYAIAAAFSTYFCMYAYRKPFAVATYEGETSVFGLSLATKIYFIIAQVIGYTASKFVGVKVVSEMPAGRRTRALVLAILVAEVALLLFAVAPAGLAAVFLLVNGLALGLVWGLVFGFLEGRQTSDVLGAGLAASFIVASGFVKSVGRVVLGWGVSESWMPAATGALFLLPIGAFIWLLSQLPPPSKQDELVRVERKPMDAEARWAFFRSLWPGLSLLTFAYVLLTAYRDFRDNFAREIWDALGYADAPSVLTTAEIPVAIGALLAVALVMWVRNNRRAIFVIHGLLLGGAVLIGVSTLLYQWGVLDPAAWMILVGLGLYLGYVPYNCVLFDRLVPAVGVAATAGFMIYVTDSLGYLGSVVLLLFRDFAEPDLSWLDFFVGLSWATAVACGAAFVLSLGYFRGRLVDR